jgi:SAM-dependent methyltransferase
MMKTGHKTARLARNWLTAFIDPQRVIGILNLPRYLVDWRRYSQMAGPDGLQWGESYPNLADRTGSTPFDAHYFYQAAWIARKLTKATPVWHVDIGSSVMMIGITSAITPTIFVDYRPFQGQLTGLSSAAGDLMALPFADGSIDSLSCMHVIEHIGLGRYGDAIDPQGSFKAACELVRILAPGGRFFFSTPIGRERVQFNAHRIFAFETILRMFDDLELVDCAVVDDQDIFHTDINLVQLYKSNYEYGCGMFEFVKAKSKIID